MHSKTQKKKKNQEEIENEIDEAQENLDSILLERKNNPPRFSGGDEATPIDIDDDEEAPPEHTNEEQSTDISPEDQSKTNHAEVQLKGDFVNFRKETPTNSSSLMKKAQENKSNANTAKDDEEMSFGGEENTNTEGTDTMQEDPVGNENNQTQDKETTNETEGNEIREQHNEKNSKLQNPYPSDKKDHTKQGKWSMKDAVLGEKIEKCKGAHTFRVRVTYQTEQKDNLELSLATEKHRILQKFETMKNEIDTDCRITAWNATGKEDKVATNISKLSPYTAAKYVGMPNGRRALGCAKNKMGFRINSNLTLEQFIDAWGQKRKNKEWAFITPAEMQSSPTAFAIGICQGSSPKMDTTLINKNIKAEIGAHDEVKIEGSWQLIDSADIGRSALQELWKEAQTQANDKTPKGVSKNRIKNKYSPSGLVIYVSDLNQKRLLKRLMTKKYGSGREKKDWARWPDGSMMRFVPFMLPTSSAKSLGKVRMMIKHHIFNKANETVRDLDAVDLFTPKSYLGGKTMQEVILSLEAHKVPNMPIFKTLVRKWSPNFLETNFQLTSYPILTEEANLTAQGLMDIIHEKYGNEALAHFPGGSILESNHHYKRNRKEMMVEDPELEKLLEDVDVTTVENILAPEFTAILALQEAGIEEGQSTIHVSMEEKTKVDPNHMEVENTTDTNNNGEKDEKSTSNDKKLQADASMSVLTGATGLSWGDDTVITGSSAYTTSEKKQKEWKESSIITKKLATIGRTFQDLEDWIADHPQQAALIKTIARTPFKRTCAIIKILAAAEVDSDMSDEPSVHELEPTVEEMKMVTTDTTKPTHEPEEQLQKNAPGGP